MIRFVQGHQLRRVAYCNSNPIYLPFNPIHFIFILAHSGSYDKMPWTEWLINNRNVFLMVAWKLMIKASAGLVYSDVPFPSSQTAFFLPHPYMVQGSRGISGVAFIRALIPCPKYLPTASHLLIPLYQGLILTYDFFFWKRTYSIYSH